MKALMIAGDRSGSGKTSITLAIAALLSRDREVQTFKVGMDYIDPSYLTGVTGRPCRNLDSFVMQPREIQDIFHHGCEGADIVLVEGVRGLYEGAEALGDTGSTASVAKALDLPVILVVSARSITRSAAAIVQGFRAFDPAVRICGVILNNVSGRQHIEKAVTAIEHYCDIPVIGAIPRQPAMELTMRHLGLVPYLEGTGKEAFHRRIADVVDLIGEHLSIDGLLSCSRDYTLPPRQAAYLSDHAEEMTGVRVAVALDEAFNFYYADLFDVIRSSGAEYVTFSPVHDRMPDADGYIIGGGYPELFLPGLECNEGMRSSLREASRNGVPVYAECGGLMYLTDAIVLEAGWQGAEEPRQYQMCGVFPGETRMPARRVVTYVEGDSVSSSPVGAAHFRGHEFHYSDVRLSPDTRYAYRLTRGFGITDTLDGAYRDGTLGSYTHLHPVSSRGMFTHFLDRCRDATK
jgi:Ni-sirohydrochlorin a,c-diamide synthase